MAIPMHPDPHGNYYQRKAWRESRKDAIAQEKAAKARAAKTCQICNRPIFAETGVIAHHGYERPAGLGFQTASCEGARHLPFEVSKDELQRHIKLCEGRLANMREVRAKLAADEIPAVVSWRVYEGLNAMRPKPVKKWADVTPATFDEVKAANAQHFLRMSVYRYEDAKQADLSGRDRAIKQLADYLQNQRQRFGAWKRTHRRGEKGEATWVAL